MGRRGSAAVDALGELLLRLRQLRLDGGVQEGAEVDVLGRGAQLVEVQQPAGRLGAQLVESLDVLVDLGWTGR
jgi:hypothetical protein